MFTRDDWKGIRMLCNSIKDPLKVGRFGLGFKSVFHVTGKIHPGVFFWCGYQIVDHHMEKIRVIIGRLLLKLMKRKHD